MPEMARCWANRPAWPVRAVWSVIVVGILSVVNSVGGCNIREIGDIVQRKFREETAIQCSTIGDTCSYDRECCKGLECLMSASHGGVGLSCQRAWLADPDRRDMAFENPESSPTEPKSEDADWMIVRSPEEEEDHHIESATQEDNEKMYPTDVLSEIENLREKKRQKLIRENQELEKLFTDREARELEQLRALREDAEIDELRRLKELRLKRKMALIKELKELRGLKAEERLNNLQELKKANATQTYEIPTNETYVDDNENTGRGNALDQTESDAVPEPLEAEALPKHKQGIHHKRKHHHHKKKDHQSLSTVNQTENTYPDDNEAVPLDNTG